MAWVLALLAFLFFSVSSSFFLTTGNMFALLQSLSVLLLAASGLALVMLVGEFDLSIAGVFPLAGLIAVKASEALGVVPAILLAVLVGAAFGLVNGWITVAFRLPSLAVTVGSMVLAIGLGFAVAGGELVQTTDFAASQVLTAPMFGVLSPQSLIQILLFLGLFFVIKRSWFGWYVYAVGSDLDRSRHSGLPVRKTVVGAFVISGGFAAVAGALQGTSIASGITGANEGFLLQAATAAILGGIALSGGKGSLLGVVGASVLLAAVSNGLGLLGANIAIIQLVNGAILLSAVIIDRPIDRVLERRARSDAAAIYADQ